MTTTGLRFYLCHFGMLTPFPWRGIRTCARELTWVICRSGSCPKSPNRMQRPTVCKGGPDRGAGLGLRSAARSPETPALRPAAALSTARQAQATQSMSNYRCRHENAALYAFLTKIPPLPLHFFLTRKPKANANPVPLTCRLLGRSIRKRSPCALALSCARVGSATAQTERQDKLRQVKSRRAPLAPQRSQRAAHLRGRCGARRLAVRQQRAQRLRRRGQMRLCMGLG